MPQFLLAGINSAVLGSVGSGPTRSGHSVRNVRACAMDLLGVCWVKPSLNFTYGRCLKIIRMRVEFEGNESTGLARRESSCAWHSLAVDVSRRVGGSSNEPTAS